MSSVQVLVNLQGSGGTPPSPNHRAALQKLLCKARLAVDIPHVPHL